MNQEIIFKNENGIEYIQFKRLLDLGVKHAYTLKGENINFSSKSEYKQKSFEKICGAISLDITKLVEPKQTHTSNVMCIDLQNYNQNLENIDGVITSQKDIVLSTKNADCILFLLYDPIKKVIANVHSGWRGTFKKIIEKTVMKMIVNYECNPKDIICCICPSIRLCHFEVDEDVKDLCEDIFSFLDKTELFIKKGEMIEGKQKYFIDTVQINKMLLKELGVQKENIIDSEICSVCSSNKISSYRVEGKDGARSVAIISL